jgi:hypothetical protein
MIVKRSYLLVDAKEAFIIIKDIVDLVESLLINLFEYIINDNGV